MEMILRVLVKTGKIKFDKKSINEMSKLKLSGKYYDCKGDSAESNVKFTANKNFREKARTLLSIIDWSYCFVKNNNWETKEFLLPSQIEY